MKVTEIFESQQLNEKPMGLLKGAALGWASKFSDAAGAKQEIGNRANFLRKKYTDYLSTNNQTATATSLIDFLNSVGYPTDAASKIVNQQQPAQGKQPATGQQGQQPAQGKQQPAAGQQPAQKQKQPAANKADTDSYEKFKGQIRQVQQPKPGATPLPDNIAKGIEPLISNLAKGDKESGSLAARKILGIAGKNYDVSKLASQWAASSKAGERFLTQSVFIAISKMLQEHGLYWSDLGIKIRLDESVGVGVYISLMEEVKLNDKVIDQALTAAVQDAFDKGMLQFDKRGKVKVGSAARQQGSSTGASFGGGTLGNQSLQGNSIDEIKDMIDQLDDNGKQRVIQFLEKG